MKPVYIFDQVTGELRDTYHAQESPLEPGVYIAPANSTDIVPPILAANQSAVFAAGTWSIVPDFRGQTVYDKSTSVSSIVTAIGALPTGVSLTKTAAQKLADAKTAQLDKVTQSCAAAIVAGFASSALGAAYTYHSQPNDQTNLIGAVASGLATVTFWCADATGVWSLVSHTAAQIKQVLADGGTQRMAYSVKLDTLAKQIVGASTVTAVQAIVW